MPPDLATLPVSTNTTPPAQQQTPDATAQLQQKPGFAGGILKGILSALSGGLPSQYGVDPNTGQVTQTPQHGETFKQMFGGILSGALEGMAGGFDKKPGESGGWGAAMARGFQARTQNLAQQDALARQKAVQQFQLQQQAKSQALDQKKVDLETQRFEATKAQTMHENLMAEKQNDLGNRKLSEANYEANLSFLDSLTKNGVAFTVSDIPGNDKSGNGNGLMTLASKYPAALKDANGDLRLPLRLEGPNGTTWKVIDIPAAARNQEVTVKLDPKMLKAAGVSVEGPLEQTMPLGDFMGIYFKGLAGMNQQSLYKSEIDKNNAEAAKARSEVGQKAANDPAWKELTSSLPAVPEVTHTAKKGGFLGMGGGEQISTKGPEGKTVSLNTLRGQYSQYTPDQMRQLISVLQTKYGITVTK